MCLKRNDLSLLFNYSLSVERSIVKYFREIYEQINSIRQIVSELLYAVNYFVFWITI